LGCGALVGVASRCGSSFEEIQKILDENEQWMSSTVCGYCPRWQGVCNSRRGCSERRQIRLGRSKRRRLRKRRTTRLPSVATEAPWGRARRRAICCAEEGWLKDLRDGQRRRRLWRPTLAGGGRAGGGAAASGPDRARADVSSRLDLRVSSSVADASPPDGPGTSSPG